jgi:hypothetical protein
VILLGRVRRHPGVGSRLWELTDLRWRSTVGLAATVEPRLADLRDARRIEAEDVRGIAIALERAAAGLPVRSVAEWFAGMARVAAAGRAPRPADYWSTQEARCWS